MNLKDFFDESSAKVFKPVAFFLALVIVFTSGTLIGFMTNLEVTVNGGTGSASVVAPGASSTPQTSTPTTPPVENNTDMTPAEIIELFNESANKVKTDAVKVTKNYEYRKYNEEKSVLPGALKGMADSAMGVAFKDDTDPIVYATKKEIIANYQVPGETWSSCLTEAEVEQVACDDKGNEYEIYIKLKPSLSPANAEGVAKAFDTITAAEVKENAPSILKDFETEYYDCEIRCKIDKESGRMTWSNYTSPVIMKADVEMFGTLAAEVAMSFEKDYTIEY
ncbi:MAG: hypothetical protein IKY78_06955 [Clostridia bacterium]|nr:hypothetical protein [Clostridia bacterium]